jgi:hypothetical protein
MKFAYIIRQGTSDQGTRGLFIQEEFECKTLELPWRNNTTNISSIPAGVYICRFRKSARFGAHYHLQDVENRNWILTHSGNLAGDTAKGFLTHSHGCILPGARFGIIKNQLAVLSSRPTLRKIIEHFEEENFILRITGG